MGASYNGHKSWNAWNVALWFGNDEGLYNMAKDAIRHTLNREDAVERIMADLTECGLTKTPDGAPYTKTSVRLAIQGF